MIKYNRRTWLNPITKDGTSSVVGFDGMVTDFRGKTYQSTFFEISDCQNKVRLHITSDDTRQEYIEKLELLRDELEFFINHLINNGQNEN